MRRPGRPSLAALLGGLHDALRSLFAQRARSTGRRRHVLQRRLLLGIDLLATIDEQVVLPALTSGDPAWQSRVAPALREVDLLRDAATLAVQTISVNRELALSLLDGLILLHADRVQSLLADAHAVDADWLTVENKVLALLGRWRSDVEFEAEAEEAELDRADADVR